MPPPPQVRAHRNEKALALALRLALAAPVHSGTRGTGTDDGGGAVMGFGLSRIKHGSLWPWR